MVPPASGTTLQCGHGSKTVEITGRHLERIEAVEASMRPRLQDRGDGSRRLRHQGERSSFNAATAPRPWRSLFRLKSMVGSPAASMRPRLQDRGDPPIIPADCLITIQGRASMRPRLQDRGDTMLHMPTIRRAGGFNAATAPRPWRSLPADPA